MQSPANSDASVRGAVAGQLICVCYLVWRCRVRGAERIGAGSGKD